MGENGTALLLVLFLTSVVGAISYFAFDYIAQYQKSSIKITNRSMYRELGISKVQVLGDPYLVNTSVTLQINDVAP
jgi:hypothetical protein